MTSFNNLAPILFHSNHGQNIRLSNDSKIAKRSDFFGNICFSNRPININEKVFIKFKDISESVVGALSFGFTRCDPIIVGSELSDFAFYDFTKRYGNWGKILEERFAVRDYVLHFCVNQFGDIYYGINGEIVDIFKGVYSTKYPFWAFIDIYGKVATIESVEKREPSPQSLNLQSSIGHKGRNIQLSNNRSVLGLKSTNVVKDGRNSDSLNAIGNECNVCYEKSRNSVLDECGHISMCYDCALKQWRGQGICPICRAVIKKVIRAYWS